MQVLRFLDKVCQHPYYSRKRKSLPGKQVKDISACLKRIFADERKHNNGKACCGNQSCRGRAQPVKSMVNKAVFPELFQAGRNDEYDNYRRSHKAERCNDRSGQAACYIADVGRRIDAYRAGR